MNSIQLRSSFSDLIPRSLDVAESFTSSSSLDLMETSIDAAASFALRIAILLIGFLSYLSSFPFVTFAIASLGLWLISQYDYTQAKKSLMEKKIGQIISESADKPKNALIIQSPKDPHGAFSMRTHVEKVRQLAKTHRIEKVVVNNEREFLSSLPPGRFDLVWIRAHGTPVSIEFGRHFKVTKDSAPQLFHTFASKIKQHGKLVLECCSVAKNIGRDACLAEHIASYCWDGAVYAPSTDISGIFGLEFDKSGTPQFNNSFGIRGRNVTRIFEGPQREQRFASIA